MLSRRSFFAGLTAAVAAPALIRTPGLLMPVAPLRDLRPPPPHGFIYPEGQLLRRADYPELFAVLGLSHEDPRRPSDAHTFRVPKIHDHATIWGNSREPLKQPVHSIMRARRDLVEQKYEVAGPFPVGLITFRMG